MTNQERQEYLNNGGVKCPYADCGSDQLAIGATDFEYGGTYVNVTCETCGREWTDIYHLTDIQSLEEEEISTNEEESVE